MSFFLQPLHRPWHAFSHLGVLGSSPRGTGRRAEPLPCSKEKGGFGIPYWASCSQRQRLTNSSPAFSTQSRGGREIWVSTYTLCILEVFCRQVSVVQDPCLGFSHQIFTLCGRVCTLKSSYPPHFIIVWINHMRFFFEKLCCGKGLLRPCSMKSVSQKSTHQLASDLERRETVTIAV